MRDGLDVLMLEGHEHKNAAPDGGEFVLAVEKPRISILWRRLEDIYVLNGCKQPQD